MSGADNGFQEQFEALKLKFAANMVKRLDAVRRSLERYARKGDREDLKDLALALHALAGAGATFDFEGTGGLAREFESEVLRAMKGENKGKQGDISRFTSFMDRLEVVARSEGAG